MLTEAFRVAREFLQELGEELEVFELVEPIVLPLC